MSVVCYADVRVGEYVLGSGPSLLTVAVGVFNLRDHETPVHEVDAWLPSVEHTLIHGGHGFPFIVPEGGIGGRESVLFLTPSLNTVVEAWLVAWTWNVESRDDGTVVAVHPYRHYWRDWSGEWETHRAAVEFPLPVFTQQVMTAHQTRTIETRRTHRH